MTHTEYMRQYREKNKEKIREYNARYYLENKEKINQQNEEYYNSHRDEINKERRTRRTTDEEWREEQNATGRVYYEENKEKRKRYQRSRRKEIVKKIDIILLHYGCQNPNCKWGGEFKPSHLDFHHLDPKTKKRNISHMTTCSLAEIATEINKCVVACRNCHGELHSDNASVPLTKTMLCKVNDDLQIIV